MFTERLIKTLVVVLITGVVLAAAWCPAIFDSVFGFFAEWWRKIATVLVVVTALLALVCVWSKKRDGISSPDCCRKKYEAIPDPYPERYGKGVSIKWFGYRSHLYLMRLKLRPGRVGTDREAQYIVAQDYSVCYRLNGGPRLTITVPRGMLTDLASVPRPFRSIVGRVGPHLEASIVHDWLYVAWQVKDKDSTDELRRFADDLYLAAMKEAGMGCKAYLIYLAVRLGGKCAFYGRNPEPWILCSEQLLECCVKAEEKPGGADRPSGNDT